MCLIECVLSSSRAPLASVSVSVSVSVCVYVLYIQNVFYLKLCSIGRLAVNLPRYLEPCPSEVDDFRGAALLLGTGTKATHSHKCSL